MSESGVLDLLAKDYTPPAWAFLRHVGNGTGRNASRTADALAMSLWPSRGLVLHGFEVKTYRGDWLRELRDPAKADEIATRCHHWWIVASDDSVVAQDDLFPPTWGLMVVRDGVLVSVREAPLLTPEPLDWPFLAAVLRRTAEQMVAGANLEARRERMTREDVARFDARKVRGRLDRLQAAARRIQKDVASALTELDSADRNAARAQAEDEGEAA